jgi:hypothetical protein
VRLVQLFKEDLKLEQQLSCARRVFFMEAGDLMHDFCSQESVQHNQCSGIGIQCLFDPWIRDPGWVKKSGSGSEMKSPDHMSESLETIFWVKILKFFGEDPGSGMEKIRIRDPG